jgi:hypothetical protein
MSNSSAVVRGIVTLALVTLFFALQASAQPAMPVPQPSPKAMVSQTIGITDVVISYHRPSVNNRKVWGDLVPFDQVWRAGANENTTISFSTPVKIEGKDVAEGTYGLHMIPTQTAWTVILSKNSTSWGSFTYNQDEDALRVTVSPQAADMQEMLKYEFDNVTRTSATVALRWEKLLVPVKIEVDTRANVLANARSSYLRGLAGFTWQGFYQAAGYCLQNNMNLEEALAWIDKSIAIAENGNNLFVKGSILEKLGRGQEAAAVENRIAKIAMSEADVNLLGYLYLGAGKKKEAIEVFKKNVKQHPDSWNAYDSLGEGYATNGDVKLAIENYTRALNMVKDDANKKRIGGILEKLSSK